MTEGMLDWLGKVIIKMNSVQIMKGH